MADFLSIQLIAPIPKTLVDVPKVLGAVRRQQALVAGQVVARGKRYPPERPNQQYVRTGDLGRSWHIRTLSDGVLIYNDAIDTRRRGAKFYANYVFGFDDDGTGQSIWHQGRWPTIGQLANRSLHARQIQDAINSALA